MTSEEILIEEAFGHKINFTVLAFDVLIPTCLMFLISKKEPAEEVLLHYADMKILKKLVRTTWPKLMSSAGGSLVRTSPSQGKAKG